jgi:hypothetical protein
MWPKSDLALGKLRSKDNTFIRNSDLNRTYGQEFTHALEALKHRYAAQKSSKVANERSKMHEKAASARRTSSVRSSTTPNSAGCASTRDSGSGLTPRCEYRRHHLERNTVTSRNTSNLTDVTAQQAFIDLNRRNERELSRTFGRREPQKKARTQREVSID